MKLYLPAVKPSIQRFWNHYGLKTDGLLHFMKSRNGALELRRVNDNFYETLWIKDYVGGCKA